MKYFIIFHYRYHRDLWTKTGIEAPNEKAARHAFSLKSGDHIISVLEMRS